MGGNKAAEIYRQKILSNVAELMHQLNKPGGFEEYYIKLLPKCSTQKAAFNMANSIYFLLFEQYRFVSYNAFLKHQSYKRRKR